MVGISKLVWIFYVNDYNIFLLSIGQGNLPTLTSEKSVSKYS